MDYKNNSNTGLIIVADCMPLSVEYIGNVHLFLNIDVSIETSVGHYRRWEYTCLLDACLDGVTSAHNI